MVEAVVSVAQLLEFAGTDEPLVARPGATPLKVFKTHHLDLDPLQRDRAGGQVQREHLLAADRDVGLELLITEAEDADGMSACRNVIDAVIAQPVADRGHSKAR